MGGDIPIVLVHGWGIDSSVWEPCLQRLRCKHDVYLLDLPGYGINREVSTIATSGLIEQASALKLDLPERYLLVGFSLGGVVASLCRESLFTDARGLITVASNRSFVACDDWVHGIDTDIFHGFLSALKEDKHRLVKRFCSLQCEGVENFRERRRLLLSQLDPELDYAVLEQGLDALQHSDLERSWLGSACPTLHQFGSLDRLVPVAAAGALAELGLKVEIFNASAHLPFVDEVEGWVASVEHFARCLV